MTSKRRVAVLDDYGKHVIAVHVQDGTIDFEGAFLECFCVPGVGTLRGKSFKGALCTGQCLPEPI
jgi:hypothetical protein